MNFDETGGTPTASEETVLEQTQSELKPQEPTNGKPVLVYDTELAAKDAQIKRLTEEFQTAKSERHLTQGEVKAAQDALAKAVAEREAIVSEKEAELKQAASELRSASEATQALTSENSRLQADYEASLAKATKLEVLAEEFPDLLRYSKLIPAHSDPETVRAACRELQAIRQADLEAARISAVTQNPVTTLTSQPSRNEPTIQSGQDIREYLTSAKDDPKEYERRRQMLLDRIAASAQRAQSQG